MEGSLKRRSPLRGDRYREELDGNQLRVLGQKEKPIPPEGANRMRKKKKKLFTRGGGKGKKEGRGRKTTYEGMESS